MASWAIAMAERRWIPDSLVRIGIRKLLRDRLRMGEACRDQASQEVTLANQLSTGPMIEHADQANEQHYEVPAAFYQKVLGRHLKYSCGYWPEQHMSLDGAEDAMLRLTVQRAAIQDGMRILELGCGWGSLSLWMAEHFPHARITAVSNSSSQRQFIEQTAARRGLDNLQVITANIADFSSSRRYDRVVSVEMFEHVRNHRQLLERISHWLTPQGKLFVHIFCHREQSYLFETQGSANWMGRHFFTGGMMPSANWLRRFDQQVHVERSWVVGGQHYQRTAEAWLSRLDLQQADVEQVFRQQLSPAAAKRQVARWRIFFMACAELFGYNDGSEWFVAHYLFAPQNHDNRVESLAPANKRPTEA
jgi:cyclopropane-fatty-acyl-phospholipid synthase